MKKRILVVTFHTTAAAMATEKACREAGLGGRLAPVPRTLSSDCGIAWRAEPALRQELSRLLLERGIETAGMDEIEL